MGKLTIKSAVERTYYGYATRLFGQDISRLEQPYAPFPVQDIINSQPQAKLIIAASLFGTNRQTYLEPLLQAIPQYQAYSNGWVVRVYLSPKVDVSWRQALIAAGAEIYLMSRDSLDLDGAYWRFLVLGEQLPSAIIDTDDKFDIQELRHGIDG